MKFQPESVQRFSFDRYVFSEASATLALHYSLDDVALVEQLKFIGGRTVFSVAEREALERCFELAHLLAGISYFKAAIPKQLVHPYRLSAAAAAFLNKVYANGLGEFAYQNGLSLHRRTFFIESSPSTSGLPLALPNRSVVPLGGGKDSLVSVELLKPLGFPVRTIAIGQSQLIKQVAQTTALEHIAIERRVDPKLFELNRLGAYNGHVPISAILASFLLCGSIIYGYDTVVMSNEASADAPNVTAADGFEVNHQYSKSSEFESDFAELVEQELLANFRYLSLLRPWSEIKVAEQFARSSTYDRVFSSCNRNFHLGRDAERRWCRNCPKCRFVFLALSPFVSRDRLLAIFSGDLLADETQRTGFAELLGLVGNKPFECVGEIGESRSALLALLARKEWQNSQLVADLGRQLPADTPPVSVWLDQRHPHRLTGRWREVIDAAG